MAEESKKSPFEFLNCEFLNSDLVAVDEAKASINRAAGRYGDDDGNKGPSISNAGATASEGSLESRAHGTIQARRDRLSRAFREAKS